MNWAQAFFIMMAIYHANGMKEQAATSMILGVLAAAAHGMGL